MALGSVRTSPTWVLVAVLVDYFNCNVWKILSLWMGELMYDTRQGTNLVPVQIVSSRKYRLVREKMR